MSFITNYSTGLAPFPRLSAPPHSPQSFFQRGFFLKPRCLLWEENASVHILDLPAFMYNLLINFIPNLAFYTNLSPLIKHFLSVGYTLNLQFTVLRSYSGLFCLSLCVINKMCTEFSPPVFYIKHFRMSQNRALISMH